MMYVWVKLCIVRWLVYWLVHGWEGNSPWIYYYINCLYTIFSQFDNSASSSSASILLPSEFEVILDHSCDTWMSSSIESNKTVRLSSQLLLDETRVSAPKFVLFTHAMQLRREFQYLVGGIVSFTCVTSTDWNVLSTLVWMICISWLLLHDLDCLKPCMVGLI